MEEAASLGDATVLALTAQGERDLAEPGTVLSPAELELLVLIDGRSTLAQIERRARAEARSALRGTLRELIAKGLARIAAKPDGNFIDPGDFFTLTPKTPAPASPEANSAADVSTAFLRRNGYCVNIARRGAIRGDAGARNLTVLVIDDDPDIGALLGKYLKLEGLTTRTAATREEIAAAFRRPPLPDLVLLDVGLTGMDGFQVLAKLREHPVLAKIPVIMLTATATREVVLKGIAAGADGHITKPFRIHPLVRAVKAVLGLAYDPNEQDWDLSL